MLSLSLKFDIAALRSLSALASCSDNPAHCTSTDHDNEYISHGEPPQAGGMCGLYRILDAVNSLSGAHEPTDSEASLVLDLVRAKRDVFRAQKSLADCVLWENEVFTCLLEFQAAAAEEKIDEVDIGLGFIHYKDKESQAHMTWQLVAKSIKVIDRSNETIEPRYKAVLPTAEKRRTGPSAALADFKIEKKIRSK
ncbi:hypothetical protein DFH29DRAFT_1006388 [Suillus ampliporus]|nr:hypothetical protein DFH29DRAFT_1006388 [Suillus ampliporus]